MVIGFAKNKIYDIAEKQQQDVKEAKELLGKIKEAQLKGADTFDENGSSYYTMLLMKLHDIDLEAGIIQNRCHELL